MNTQKLFILKTIAIVAGLLLFPACDKTPVEETPEPEILIEGEVLVDGATVSRIESCFYSGYTPYPDTEVWQFEAFEKCYDDYRSAVKNGNRKLWYQYQSLDGGKNISEKIVLMGVDGHNDLSVSWDNENIVPGSCVASVETLEVKPSFSQNKQYVDVELSLTTDNGEKVEVRLSGIALFDGRW